MVNEIVEHKVLKHIRQARYRLRLTRRIRGMDGRYRQVRDVVNIRDAGRQCGASENQQHQEDRGQSILHARFLMADCLSNWSGLGEFVK